MVTGPRQGLSGSQSRAAGRGRPSHRTIPRARSRVRRDLPGGFSAYARVSRVRREFVRWVGSLVCAVAAIEVRRAQLQDSWKETLRQPGGHPPTFARKFDLDALRDELVGHGFDPVAAWTDGAGDFSLTLARVDA